ncbi:MAG TPA: tonB-system energizer ExbB [Methylovirgula sp.]|nr:tonB-system energizer ExbB [Methylovirgula sp.]
MNPAPAPAGPSAAPQVKPAPQVPAAAPAAAPTNPANPAMTTAAPPVPVAVAPATPAAAPPQAPAPSASPVIPHELSVWSMFMSADIVVKGVMGGLAFASLVTWTVFIAKSFELNYLRRRTKAALHRVKKATTLAEAHLALGKNNSVLSSMLGAAAHELRIAHDVSGDRGITERVTSILSEIARADARLTRRGTGLLATIGATAPFVGLFGTVWGIMNSFIGISKAQTTNLAVVAPGIAEALLATAIGLVTAIPAVIIYNHFSRSTKGYLELVSRASGATLRLLSRDLDRRERGAIARAAE